MGPRGTAWSNTTTRRGFLRWVAASRGIDAAAADIDFAADLVERTFSTDAFAELVGAALRSICQNSDRRRRALRFTTTPDTRSVRLPTPLDVEPFPRRDPREVRVV